MSLFGKITQGLSQLSDLFSQIQNKQVDGSIDITSKNPNQTEQTNQTSFWSGWFGNRSSIATPGFNGGNQALRFTAQKVKVTEEDLKASMQRQLARQNFTTANNDNVRSLVQTGVANDDNKKIKSQAPPTIKPIKIDVSQQDQPTRGYKPYTIQIVLPKGTEKISHEQLERAVIRDVFSHHGIYTSRAAIEDFLKTQDKLDLNEQIYRNEQGETVATRDRVRGIMPEAREITDKVTGKTHRGYELTITGEFQASVLETKEKAKAVTKAGTKVVPELSMNERMSKAMQIAYDKHLPHTVGEAVREVNPKQLMVGVAVAGSIVAVATKAGAAKAIPLIGAGVTLAQISSYYAESEAFLKMCAEAKTEADLDKAAQQFASIVKQGGLDVGLTLATAGIGKLGAVSRAGGKLVDDVARIADDAAKATLGKFKQWNDEIVVGMKQAYGEDLAFETNSIPIKTNGTSNVLEDLNIYSKSDELDMLKTGSTAGKDAINETAEQGLSEKAQASAKRLKGELSKEELKAAKEQLVTLNVARTEMMARLDNLANDVNLSPAARTDARTAYNAIRDHLTQDDLAGALRDVHGKPVTVSGSGETYNHLDEVESALASLERLKTRIVNEMTDRAIRQARSANPNFSQYQQLSKDVDTLTEMTTKIEIFLKIGK